MVADMMIKPIETLYKGYRFRSRLEARWAVLFDATGMNWEYEREGFDLGEAGWYLPDFWLPTVLGQGCWVEVKAQQPNHEEWEKVKTLSKLTHKSGVVVVGVPGDLPNPQVIWPILQNKVYVTDLIQCLSGAFDNPLGIRDARSARFEHGEVG